MRRPASLLLVLLLLLAAACRDVAAPGSPAAADADGGYVAARVGSGALARVVIAERGTVIDWLAPGDVVDVTLVPEAAR